MTSLRRRNLMTAAVLVAIVVGVPFSIYWVRSHAVAPTAITQESPANGQSQTN